MKIQIADISKDGEIQLGPFVISFLAEGRLIDRGLDEDGCTNYSKIELDLHNFDFNLVHLDSLKEIPGDELPGLLTLIEHMAKKQVISQLRADPKRLDWLNWYEDDLESA